MSTNVIALPRRGSGSQVVTKQQLAAHLGRSTRWVEQRVAEGMPVIEGTDRYGRRRYDLAKCEAWLAAGRPKRANREDRLAALERQVADLAHQVSELRRARLAGGER